MNGLRHEALARPRLAGQQNRAVGAGDGLDHLEHTEHRLAAADDVRELVRQPQRTLEEDVLLLQLAILDFLADLHLEEIDVERLAQVVACPEPHRLHRRVGRRERRDHDAEDVLIDFLGGAQDLDTTEIRHLDVRNQQVDGFAFDEVDCRAPVFREHHFVAFAPQHDGQQLAHRPLVVDDENARRAAIGRGLGALGGATHVVLMS
jgi:hypothetical protein